MRYEFNNELFHYGIKGQKWGVRNYQNEDGTLTPAGKDRYNVGKEYEKERRKNEEEHYNKMLKDNEKYQKLDRITKRLQNKYDFDEYRNDTIFSEANEHRDEDRWRAKKEHWHVSEKKERIEDDTRVKAKNQSYEDIKKKYGEDSLKDIEYYMKNKGIKHAVNSFFSALSRKS